MKVTLRNKKLAKGKTRLYLDYYPAIINPHTGVETRREFLDLFVYDKPKTETEREHNRQTKIQAENVRAERQLKAQQENYDFLKNPTKTNFIDFSIKYLQRLKRKQESVVKYIRLFFKDKPLEEISHPDCTAFREYLKTPIKKGKTLSNGTQIQYFQKFCSILKSAEKEEKIRISPAKNIQSIKSVKAKRNFLSLEELIILAKTPCEDDVLKRMSLFSAMTGLRLSDLRQEKKRGVVFSNGLQWCNIKFSEAHGYYIDFNITKTNEAQEMHFISQEAYELLGERGNENDFIFNIKEPINTKLRIWLLEAGIKHKITFHCFRHTYATLLITQGIDIYTVSKMLGHNDIKTTQIYAKIVDSKKKEAANSISLK